MSLTLILWYLYFCALGYDATSLFSVPLLLACVASPPDGLVYKYLLHVTQDLPFPALAIYAWLAD